MDHMNIILVVFDTLRKDCVGAYGAPPWGPVQTPHLDAFAAESVTFTRAYPESLPTLPARRAIYTGERVYPYTEGEIRLKGDQRQAAGLGTDSRGSGHRLAELLHESGYRTGLISDLYHQFKPSKNFARGFDQWMFLRGQEIDAVSQRAGAVAGGDRLLAAAGGAGDFRARCGLHPPVSEEHVRPRQGGGLPQRARD